MRFQLRCFSNVITVMHLSSDFSVKNVLFVKSIFDLMLQLEQLFCNRSFPAEFLRENSLN